MSNPLEKDQSQNSIEEFEVTGWEIVPVVDYQSPGLHSKVATILRLMVSQVITQIKDTLQIPVVENSDTASVGAPTSSHKSEDLVGTAARARKRQAMTSSILVGDFPVTFEFPEYFTDNNINMDRVASSFQNFFMANNEGNINVRPAPQFSFRERLENWNIECRQRASGRCDVFYRYPKSRRLFRSISEVVNFLLYEIYPDNARKENKGTLEDNDQDNQMAIEATRGKRKRKSTCRGGRRRKHKKMAKKNGGLAETEVQAAIEEEHSSKAEVVLDISEDWTKYEEDQEKNLPAEHEKETSTSSDLLDISEDWTAYESLFNDFFDSLV